MGRALALACLAFLACVGCGQQEAATPLSPAALRERHREELEAGRYEMAARSLEALQDRADAATGGAEERTALAGAYLDRVQAGTRFDESTWIREGLDGLDPLLDASEDVLAVRHAHLRALLLALDWSWTNEQPDSAARLLHDIEEDAAPLPDDPEIRTVRVHAWARSFLAGLSHGDDSLSATALDRLDAIAMADSATAEEHRAYLEAVEQGQERVLGSDLRLEAAALRQRAALLLEARPVDPVVAAIQVRMLALAAVHEAERGREEAPGLLAAAEAAAAALELDAARRETLDVWLDARRYLVHRAARHPEAAAAALVRLRERVAAKDASSEATRSLAIALSRAARDADSGAARVELVGEAERLTAGPHASLDVLVSFGATLAGAAERARGEGQLTEAAGYVERLRAGARDAESPQLKQVLSSLLEAVESASSIPPTDLPR